MYIIYIYIYIYSHIYIYIYIKVLINLSERTDFLSLCVEYISVSFWPWFQGLVTKFPAFIKPYFIWFASRSI